MVVELGLVEQRYKAVCEVLDGATVMVLGVELITGDEVFRNVPGLVAAGAPP